MRTYDVVVVGLGIVGASALHTLAVAGANVLGIDAHGPTHAYGSSHGDSRIFRRAYWEGETYLPLLDRADQLWTDLQEQCQEQVIVRTGGVFAGARDSGVVAMSRKTAESGGIPYEMLDAAALRDRFPAFQLSDEMEAIHEPGAYMILADRARLSLLDLAVTQGATARFGERVVEIRGPRDGIGSRGGVSVVTGSGESFVCRSVVVATGPWMAGELVEDVRGLIRPMRVPIYWFDPRPARAADFRVGRFPVFLHQSADGRILYGCPRWRDIDGGVKVGFHNWQQRLGDPNLPGETVGAAARAEMAGYACEVFPGLDPATIRGRTCYYTISGDDSFLIGSSRTNPQVVYASACSGHGFKFAPAVGESIARLALGEAPRVGLDAYTPSRFDHPDGSDPGR